MPPDLPLVEIDDVAIGQVLVNLLDNALEYTPTGTSIDLEAHAASGAVILDVADRGPGLPAGVEHRVFDKFFRAHPTASATSTPHRGIGLGLAICHGIITAHGGTIQAFPRPGGGALFRLTLPPSGPPPRIDTSE
jgi:two-component system sensor histidine kinase KdpD